MTDLDPEDAATPLGLDQLLGATVDDLVFSAEEIPAHFDRPARRVAFKLIRVGPHPIPTWIRLSYVVGSSAAGQHTYVVLWRDPAAQEPDVHDVPSEGAAKAEVLSQLREQCTGRDGRTGP